MSVGNGQNTDDIYARIRSAILDGELAAGAVMSQVALAVADAHRAGLRPQHAVAAVGDHVRARDVMRIV